MRTLVITEHPEFGKVRTVEAGGRVWFCARDVASALGYANPKDAVNRHCRPKGVRVHDLLFVVTCSLKLSRLDVNTGTDCRRKRFHSG